MLQGAVAGLAAGGVNAVVAVCLVLMSRLTRVVNFAQTAIGMFGAFAAVGLHGLGLPVWVATIAGVLIGAAVSALTGLMISAWLAEASTGLRSAVTVCMLLVLITVSFLLFGTRPLPFPPLLPGVAFSLGGVVVYQVTVLLVVLAVLVAVGAHGLLTRTLVGLRLRALSERPVTAELAGVRIAPLTVAVWAATGMLATFVVSIIAPLQSNDALSLSTLVIPGAAAALAGGFTRLGLAVMGGLGLGLLDGVLAADDALAVMRILLPLVAIVALLLVLQRRAVWDEAR